MCIHHDVSIMMTRTQISIEREMLRQARLRAAERGISLAEYVRSLVAADLGETPAAADVSAIFGLFDSGGSNIARDKDRMLGDAVSELHRK